MNHPSLERILDRSISKHDLILEIGDLKEIGEHSSFWLKIASDETYPVQHRAISICQLFKRHIQTPIDIVALARILDAPDWINSHSVSALNHLKGEIPLQWHVGHTILTIRPFINDPENSSAIIYLQFSGLIDADTFVEIIKNIQHPGAPIKLLNVACAE